MKIKLTSQEERNILRKYLSQAYAAMQKVNNDAMNRIRVRRNEGDLAVIGRDTEKEVLIVSRYLEATLKNFKEEPNEIR